MKRIALIEKAMDGTFGIYTPEFRPVIIGEGKTIDEAKQDFEFALYEIIDFFSQPGRSLPVELIDIEIEYKYDIISLFYYYEWINIFHLARIAGVSPSLVRRNKKGKHYVSEYQVFKIESTLRQLGKELEDVRFI